MKGNPMAELVECPKCKSVYELTKHKTPSRDKDSIECKICGTTIKSWNGGAFYTAILKTQGQEIIKENDEVNNGEK
jgi:predicted Zn finger-like uncharacterized protein